MTNKIIRQETRVCTLIFFLFQSLLMIAQDIDSTNVRNNAIEDSRQLKSIFKFDAALDKLLSIKKIEDNDEIIESEIADCHFQCGNYKDAYCLYSSLSQNNPQKIFYKLRQMLSAYRLKEYSQTVSLGKDILQQDTIPAIITIIGDSYYQLEQYDSALVYYNKALDVKPINESVVNKISKIYLDRKEYGKVISITDSFLAFDNDNIIISPIKGLAYFCIGEYDKAIEVLERQNMIGNNNYGVHFYLGQSYWQTNVLYRADEELNRAWQIDSSDVNLALAIASVKADSFLSFEADIKPWLDKASKMLEPNHAALSRLHQQYGLAYYKKQDSWDLAINHYKKAYKHNTKYITALSTIAYCYEQMHNYKEAIEWYKKYIKVAVPGSRGYEFAKQSIDQLSAELFMREQL